MFRARIARTTGDGDVERRLQSVKVASKLQPTVRCSTTDFSQISTLNLRPPASRRWVFTARSGLRCKHLGKSLRAGSFPTDVMIVAIDASIEDEDAVDACS